MLTFAVMELHEYIEAEFSRLNTRLDGFAREIKAIRDNQVSQAEMNKLLENVQTTKTACNRMMAEFHLLGSAMNRLDPDYTPLPEMNPNPEQKPLGETFKERNKDQ